MQNKGVNKSQINATLDMNGPPEGHSYVKYNTEASQESSFLVSIWNLVYEIISYG